MRERRHLELTAVACAPENLYVLGHPVEHSKSPAMHNAAYAALSLPWRYGFADCADAATARRFVDDADWLALNVTMPYKPLALECAQKASVSARLAGGANVLVHAADGLLHADNVDGAGCVAFLRRCGSDVAGKNVAVCGTGPTSLSIAHACLQAGASQVTLLGRNGDKARSIAQAYRASFPTAVSIEACSYADGESELAQAHVIVDATPLGMKPDDPAPFETSLLHAGQVVVDVVYGHGESRLLAAAHAAGCAAFDGAGMLVGQAVETVHVIAHLTGLFEIPADVDLHAVMAEAAGFEMGQKSPGPFCPIC